MFSSRLVLAVAVVSLGLLHAPLSSQQGAWSQNYPKVSPPARLGHAMTYDSVRQRAVLFGGSSGGPSLGDTWEWAWNATRSEWSWESTPPKGPSARRQHAMAYHEATGQTIRSRAVVASSMIQRIKSEFHRWQLHRGAVRAALESFTRRSDERPTKSMTRVIFSDEAQLIVQVCFGNTRPPRRAWFSVARGDLATTPLTSEEVSEFYEIPAWL